MAIFQVGSSAVGSSDKLQEGGVAPASEWTYPTADVQVGGWTLVGTGPELYKGIDEDAVPNDADYITATAT